MSLQNKELESLLQDVLDIVVSGRGHFASIGDDYLAFYDRTVARFSDFIKANHHENKIT